MYVSGSGSTVILAVKNKAMRLNKATKYCSPFIRYHLKLCMVNCKGVHI